MLRSMFQAHLQNVTLSLVTFVHLSIRMQQLCSRYTDFDEIWKFENFENSDLITIWQQ